MAAEFVAPESVAEAIAALDLDGAVAVGGGTQVGLLLRQRLIDPARLVWLGRVPELRSIRVRPDGAVEIGATATLAEIARSADLRRTYPVLAGAASEVGNPRVRAVATLGGHLAHADPRQDLPPVLLALRATARLHGPSGGRELALDHLFSGPFETAIGEGELVTSVVLPPGPPGHAARYVRFTPAGEDDYPTVGVAVSLARSDGEVSGAALALGGVGPRPLLVGGLERLLRGRPGAAEVAAAAAAAAAACDPTGDRRGSAAYKRAMARLWTRRALAGLLGLDSG